MAKLTAQQIEFFAAMEGTFNTPGWTLLRQGWVAERDGLYERMFFSAKSYEDMQTTRVRYGILNEMIGLPEEIERQKQETLDMPEEDELV